jgi:hypothetical protein
MTAEGRALLEQRDLMARRQQPGGAQASDPTADDGDALRGGVGACELQRNLQDKTISRLYVCGRDTDQRSAIRDAVIGPVIRR